MGYKLTEILRKTKYRNILRAIVRDDFKCVECGYKYDLIVHHIDGSGIRKLSERNDNLDNLKTLCKKCHAKTHNYTESERNKEVIKMIDNGMSFAEVGRQFDISRQRAHQIYHKCNT